MNVVKHFASAIEAIVDAIPDDVAIVAGDHRQTYAETDERAARLAAALATAGLGVESKVGLLLFNGSTYIEAYFGVTKMRGVPVNLNYRYRAEELAYVLDNCDAEALVYHSSLGPVVAEALESMPGIKLLLEVADTDDPSGVPGAMPYEETLARTDPMPRIPRSEDDLTLYYTGGTTGMPKGAMGDMRSMVEGLLYFGYARIGLPQPSWNHFGEQVAGVRRAGRAVVSLTASPLMHGTGWTWGGAVPMLTGGTSVLLTARAFDAAELWSTVQREGVDVISIVGDVFARPMIAEIDAARAAGRPYDLRSLRTIISAGATFSYEHKHALFERLPWLEVADMVGATEGGILGTNVLRRGETPSSTFVPPPGCRVLDDDFKDVVPGSGQIGRLAVTGPLTFRGYYKDPERSAKTFPVLDGVQYVLPGDLAMIEADGTVALIGRDSSCINTGGEKVFPEEVERVVRRAAGVSDCLVLGLPDDQWGQAVAALVVAEAGAPIAADDIVASVKSILAGYKAPRVVKFVPTIPRRDGKPDFPAARAMLEQKRAGSTGTSR